jgi:hypothetical protein
MRTFLASALIIATILIGQQWAAKASAAERVGPVNAVVVGQR